MKEKQGFRTVRNCTNLAMSGLLAPYLNGNASPENIRILEEHVSLCEECQEKMGLIMMIGAYGFREGRSSRPATLSPDGSGKVIAFRR